jgi:sirohydrochlorin cobaltochelatase
MLHRIMRPSVRALQTGILLLTCCVARAVAQPVGTLVIAHGGDSIWNTRVLDVAARARTGGPIRVSFLMGPAARTHGFQAQVRALQASGVQRLVLVPLLVSSTSGHYDQIRWLAGDSVVLDEAMTHHLHMGGLARVADAPPMTVAPGLDDAEELAEVLADRVRAALPSAADKAVMLVGHGPESAEAYAAWMRHLRPVAAAVQRRTGARDVRVELVRDDAPAAVRAEAVLRVRELIELQAAATGDSVTVIPVLVSKGLVSRTKVRTDVAGTPSRYFEEPLLPHAAMTRYIERRVREATRTTRTASGSAP